MTYYPEIRSMGDVSRFHARERGDVPALIFEGEAQTYRQFDERCSRVANGLIAEGVRPQERVAFLDKNSAAFFELMHGAAKANAPTVAVNWRLAPPEVAYIVNDAKAKVLFVGAPFYALIDKIKGELKHVTKIVAIHGGRPEWESYHAWRDRQSAADPKVAVEADDVCLQMYTSGTTGLPKGVMLTNRNFIDEKSALVSDSRELEHNQWSPADVSLVTMPVFHVAGAGWGFAGLYNGAKNIVLSEFVPQTVLSTIASERVTKIVLVPAAIKFTVEHPAAASTDFSSLKYVLYGASPIPLELLKNAMQVMKCGFVQVYGMTETNGAITYLPPEDHDPKGNQRMRSAGKPMPGVEIKIIDAEGRALKTGEIGEVCIRSVQNMKGYWNLAKETAKTLDADGWVHSGDAGYVDADGYVFIHDRVKDMIVSGGENVYGAEVESAIFGHPAVADVAVIGVPDDQWGEAVKAIIVLKPGLQATPDDIIAFARARIAAYKCPKTVDFIAALPRNPTGKILKRELRAPYWAGRDRQVN
jgi:acyl-CoA synthetase (AMP-forming)/AMP-acid ligase II